MGRAPIMLAPAAAALVLAGGCAFEPLSAVRADVQAAPVEDAGAGVEEDAAVEVDAVVEDTAVPDTFVADVQVEDAAPPETCGDGRLDEGEVCDDGNRIPSDGCAECRIDLGYLCAREPSRCLPAEEVAIADSSTVSCSMLPLCGDADDPCCTLQSALARNRRAVLLRGARVYSGRLTIGSGRSVELLAEEGAVLEGENPALEIRQGAQVTVYGLTIRGMETAVMVRETGTRASFFECRAGPTGGLGFDIREGAELLIERTTVFDNAAGGIKLDSSAVPFRVVNTVISGNGAAATEAGGVYIKKAAPGSVFANNSIAGNRVGGGNPQPTAEGGIRCDATAADIFNTIVWDNSGELERPSTVSPACRVRHSNLGPVYTSTVVTNFSEDPLFIDESELRIMPLSPCVERGDPQGTIDDGSSAPNDDVDREQRPINSRVDVGADEAG